jgi:hypothetical protein
MSDRELLETILTAEVLNLASQISQKKSHSTGIDESINRIVSHKETILEKLIAKLAKN